MSTPEPTATSAAIALAESWLLAGYQPPVGRDEMLAGPGKVQPHWHYLLDSLTALGRRGLERRVTEALQLIRNNDVTFNVYGDPRGPTRPWRLDLVPRLIESAEWAQIEAALAQRAELLRLILADLYGPRQLIRKGLLPPELVYTHPGFLRPVAGVPAAQPLPLYAADLGRAADGQVYVTADRAQAPTGAGYALENRLVLSRVLPSLFRDAHVHRLATFFRTVRATLAAQAPARDEAPRVVLLSPGPHNEVYFEHAYLANYLGYTLVQGSDLVVRDNHVWLRTLDDLQRVDVILRRLDAEYCDPVELREDSYLGIPGLLAAARSGAVAIANPLGCGVIENPGLLPFLPALAQQLLGESLRLPSVPTWWCGDPPARDHVLQNLERLWLRAIDRTIGPVAGAALSKSQREDWRDRIRAQPHRYVAQFPIELSTAPVFEAGRLQAYPSVLRSFLVGGDDGYEVMPGGLTRVARRARHLLGATQFAGLSKDTWVLASEPERADSLLVPLARAPAVGREAGISRRVADNLYWVGRYAERAEGTVRLLRIILLHLAGRFYLGDRSRERAARERLLQALTYQTTTYPGFVGEGAEARLATPVTELLSVIRDGERPGSLAQTVQALLQAARAVRDRLSSDLWRVLTQIETEWEALRQTSVPDPGDLLDQLDRLVTLLAAFTGLSTEDLTHGYGWYFLDAGRRLERAIHSVRLLRTTLVPVTDPREETLLLESVLTTMDALMTYHRRCRTGLEVGATLDLVLHDETNPRSVAYQLVRLEEHAARLPGAHLPTQRSAEELLLLEALTQLRLADPTRLIAAAEDAHLRPELDQLLVRLDRLLPALSDALGAAYLWPAEQPQQLVPLRAETPP